MNSKIWGYGFTTLFLIVCLAGGLFLAERFAPEPVIGMIRFEGVIDFGTANTLMEVADAARQDPSVAGVVLEILSPGGLATSSESAFYSLLKLRDEKPLMVVIDGLAASGGYYFAVAGNRIYAPSSSYVGNVGTRGPRPIDPMLSPGEMSSGPYKLMGGDRFDRIRQLDVVKDAFVGNVVHQRANAEINPLNIDYDAVAEARIYLGSEAVAVGLIDHEGGRSDAIIAAAEMSGVSTYQTVDLMQYYGLEWPMSFSFQADVRNLVETAPPEAVFLIDSRIPLPDLALETDLDRHLMRLRESSRGSLISAANSESNRDWGATLLDMLDNN